MNRPAVDAYPLLPHVKLALRIKSNAFDSEILQLIAACFADLGIGGVATIDTDDPLLVRSAVLYCKSNFDDEPHSKQAYEDLKVTMSLAREYGPTE